MPMTSAQRSEAINRLRERPEVMVRLRGVVARMERGCKYTVMTERNGRRRTVTGFFIGEKDGVVALQDEGKSRLQKVAVDELILINVHTGVQE